jgi:prepilin-type N-terminal cleavage/methylation domain-containing protein
VTTNRRGFTLLEVLVAVALLGLVVTVLAQSAIQGMNYEGDAGRRMRASLLADRELARIESSLKLGVPPQAGHQESEEQEEFHLVVDVQPMDPVQAGLAALLATPEGGGADTSARKLTASEGPSPAALPLFLIGIRVAWTEGVSEQAVTRSTFAYDATAALQALAAANGQQQNPEGETNRPPPEEQPPPEEEAQ